MNTSLREKKLEKALTVRIIGGVSHLVLQLDKQPALFLAESYDEEKIRLLRYFIVKELAAKLEG